jgi:hypothetical protein
MYNTAVMHLAGKGTVKACQPALEYLKLLVEKGPLAATLQAGHEAFFRGHHSQVISHVQPKQARCAGCVWARFGSTHNEQQKKCLVAVSMQLCV